MATQKCCLNSHFNLSRRGNGCMREYENRVNSKALVLTPSETHFCCARHNPDAKTFTHSPTGHASSSPSPLNQVPLHSFFNQIFFMSCFKNKRTITGRVQAGGGRRARRVCRSQKWLKLNLVMDRSLFSLTHDRFLNSFYILTSYINIKILGGKIFLPDGIHFTWEARKLEDLCSSLHMGGIKVSSCSVCIKTIKLDFFLREGGGVGHVSEASPLLKDTLVNIIHSILMEESKSNLADSNTQP